MPSEDKFSESFQKYHLRALEDEAVEAELQEVWVHTFTSFHHIHRLSLGHSVMNRGGRDAVRSDPLSFHRIPADQDIPAVVSAQRSTGSRLLRLAVPLLCDPALPVKRLSIEVQGDCESISTISGFSLSSLEHLNFGFGLLSSAFWSSETQSQPVQAKASIEMKHRGELLAKLLAASRLSLTELLLVHARLSYSSLWSGPVFPADICCTSLQTLHLSAFNLKGTCLISALQFNFPNLQHLIFANYAEPLLDDSPLDGWPSFFRMLQDVYPPRRLEIEGIVSSLSTKSTMGDATFCITLHKPYARQYQAFTEQACSRRAAISVLIRRYMDYLMEWDEVDQSVRDYPFRYWFGSFDEDDTDDEGGDMDEEVIVEN